VAKVVEGKSFDYGTVCSSEQAVVAEEALRDQVIAELKKRKAYFATPEQKAALGKLLVLPNWNINPACVGQAPTKIAQMAGFSVPADTSIIVCELDGVGKQHPLSVEKLSPVLALYFTPDFAGALNICEALLKFGGLGHTAVIYSRDDQRIREFGARMPAMRVLVNTPAPQGSTGITTNVFPSMTLGCGAAAGNSTGDNVGPQHLINIKRLAYAVRTAEEAFETPVDSAAAGPVDRRTITEAVERYLAQRGLSTSPSVVAASARTIAEEVVDQFLTRRTAAESSAPAPGKG
jgi:acyl-CoA reductase-like NAD-dependent aldehyde dehydrogenase